MELLPHAWGKTSTCLRERLERKGSRRPARTTCVLLHNIVGFNFANAHRLAEHAKLNPLQNIRRIRYVASPRLVPRVLAWGKI